MITKIKYFFRFLVLTIGYRNSVKAAKELMKEIDEKLTILKLRQELSMFGFDVSIYTDTQLLKAVEGISVQLRGAGLTCDGLCGIMESVTMDYIEGKGSLLDSFYGISSETVNDITDNVSGRAISIIHCNNGEVHTYSSDTQDLDHAIRIKDNGSRWVY